MRATELPAWPLPLERDALRWSPPSPPPLVSYPMGFQAPPKE